MLRRILTHRRADAACQSVALNLLAGQFRRGNDHHRVFAGLASTPCGAMVRVVIEAEAIGWPRGCIINPEAADVLDVAHRALARKYREARPFGLTVALAGGSWGDLRRPMPTVRELLGTGR